MQNRFDLDVIDKVVSTQYNDYRGYVAIDEHGDSRGIFSMCKENGIDMEKYFLYGVSIYDSEPVGKNHDLWVKVFLIDKDVYGHSFDEIAQHLGDVELVMKDIRIPYSKIGDYIKRISIGIVTPISNKIHVVLPDGL